MKKRQKRPAAATTAPTWFGSKDLQKMLVPIGELLLDSHNPRKHDDRNLEALRASLFEFGQLKPVVVQRSTMQVVAGNGTLRAAQALGWSHLAAAIADLTPAQAKAFAVADNRTAELASWNRDILAETLADPELDALLGSVGFTATEIEKLIGGADDLEPLRADDDELGGAPASRGTAAPAQHDNQVDDEDGGDDDGQAAAEDDELPELPTEPITKPGDVWICGEHQVRCDDSLGETAAKWIGRGAFGAVVTDPPYAIFGSSTGVSSDIADDKMVRPFFAAVAKLLAAALRKFGHGYVFTDWRSWSALWEGFKGSTVAVRNMLVWNKRSGMGTNYTNAHELVAFLHKLPQQHANTSRNDRGVRGVPATNVFDFPRPTGDERPHHAAKPVPLLQKLIENSTDAGDLVLDPFGGGGSTLIACEKAGRRARVIEIEPRWVDVIVQRWERITAQKARRESR